jgi:hypothetical protein
MKKVALFAFVSAGIGFGAMKIWHKIHHEEG